MPADTHPSTLILVPTPLERDLLAELGREWGGFPGSLPCTLCGFGPVSAAARTAQLLAEHSPRRVLLVGIAGSLKPALAAPARALSFTSVCLDGVGAGLGAHFLPPSRLGLPQWDGEPGGRIEESLELAGTDAEGLELLTVCAASASQEEAEARRQRYPCAVAEDMEGFGVALACRLARVPLAIVRGLSNVAGERDPRRWCVRAALAAALPLALELATRAAWPNGEGARRA